MARQFTYGKNDRLKSRKVIEMLFNSGHSFSVYPIKVLYKIESSEVGTLQAGVAVSKRLFKKAVDRNYVKRLMRESYRIQKNDLKEMVRSKQVAVYLFFIYLDKTKPTFSVLSETIKKCLTRVDQKLKDERPA